MSSFYAKSQLCGLHVFTSKKNKQQNKTDTKEEEITDVPLNDDSLNQNNTNDNNNNSNNNDNTKQKGFLNFWKNKNKSTNASQSNNAPSIKPQVL